MEAQWNPQGDMDNEIVWSGEGWKKEKDFCEKFNTKYFRVHAK